MEQGLPVIGHIARKVNLKDALNRIRHRVGAERAFELWKSFGQILLLNISDMMCFSFINELSYT